MPLSGIFKEISTNEKIFHVCLQSDVLYFKIFWKKKKNWFPKYLIVNWKINIKKKNAKYLNTRYWIFNYCFTWTHILRYLLDPKPLESLCWDVSQDSNLSIFNGLALFYSSRFRKTSMILPSEVPAFASLLRS